MNQHNTKLSKLIDDLEPLATSPNGINDLVAVCEYAQHFGAPIKFETAEFYFSGIMFCILGGAFISALFLPEYFTFLFNVISSTSNIEHSTVTLILGAIGITSILYGIRQFNTGTDLDQRITKLNETIRNNAALLHNGLAPYSDGLNLLLNNVQDTYGDYHRGDHDREIVSAHEGYFGSDNFKQTFNVITLRAVDKRVETNYENGKFVTKTVYITSYRYSIIIKLNTVRNVSVSSNLSNKINRHALFNTTYQALNDKYQISANHMIDATKFAKPVVVLWLFSFLNGLAKPNLEFDAHGNACLSFDNDDLLMPSMDKCSLEHPAEMANIISRDIPMANLRYILSEFRKLHEMTNNNFANA